MEIGAPIFLSHSNKDEAEVKRIALWLRELSLNPWVSYDDINRINYGKEISSAIASCGCFLLVLSQKSIKSRFVLKEINFAAEIGKKIFIYQLDDEVTIPQDLLLMMGPVHKILTTKFPNDCLERLAKQLLNEAGVAEADAKTQISDAVIRRNAKISEVERQYSRNLQVWRDEYLDSRWQSGKFRDRPSLLDIETLDDRAKELGIEIKDIERICSLSRDKDAKRLFTKLLNGALQHASLGYQRLYTLEKRRIAFLISRAEVKDIVQKRRAPIPKLAGKIKATSDNYPDIDWLVSLLKGARSVNNQLSTECIDNQSHKPESKLNNQSNADDNDNCDSINCRESRFLGHAKTDCNSSDQKETIIQKSVNIDPVRSVSESGKAVRISTVVDDIHANSARKLAKALANDSDVFVNLYDSETENRSLVARQHNIDNIQADRIILLILPTPACEVNSSILISLDCLSVCDPMKAEPSRFPLIDASSCSRIKVRSNKDSSGNTVVRFEYVSRAGSTKECCSMVISSKRLGIGSLKLLEWLILVCQSTSDKIYLATNFSPNAIAGIIQWIGDSNLETLLCASKKGSSIIERDSVLNPSKAQSGNLEEILAGSLIKQEITDGQFVEPEKATLTPATKIAREENKATNDRSSESDHFDFFGVVFFVIFVLICYGIARACLNILWFLLKKGAGVH